MNRLVHLSIAGSLIVGFVAGYALRTDAVAARAQTSPVSKSPQKLYWPAEDLQKLHADLQALVAKGQKPNTAEFVTLPPGWRLNHRVPGDMADNAEIHDKATDFFVIVAGTGVVGVGGEIQNRKPLMNASGPVPGEYRGWPVKDGMTYKVKAGDWVHLPPNTAHWARADPGGLTFLLVKVNP